MRLNRKWLAAIIVATILAGVLIALRTSKAATTYETAEIERGDIVTSISASGKIQALNTIEIGSQISGQIIELDADFNTPVKKGQILARIDPSTFASRVEQSAAQAANAQSGVTAARAQIAQAQAAVVEAQRNYDTLAHLVPNGFVTKRSLETAEAGLREARAQLAATQAGLAGANAQATAARATLEQNQIDVTRTIIRAPVDGIVIDRAVNLGQTVAASLQAPKLFVIAEDLSRMQVEADVDEADIGRVRTGQRVEFTVDAYPEDRFEGRVSEVRIAGVETNSVVTYTVVIEAPNPERKLLPGMTANAEIILGEVKNVLKIPAAALRYQPASEATEQPAGQSQGGPLSTASGSPRGFGRPDPSVMVERLANELDLTADQRTKIAAIMEQSFRGMSGGRSGDRNARRQQREAMRVRIAALLTPAQRARYDAMQPAAGRGQGNARTASVWVLGANNKPERRMVRIVQGDEDFAAGVGGDLKTGDKVIIGEATPDKDATP